jgi:hypothetical protein
MSVLNRQSKWLTMPITKRITDAIRRTFGTTFNPADLFTGGYTGGWYDPSDLSIDYTLSSATVQVTADGDALGFLYDKSQSLVLGAEKITNGGFASGASWTLGPGVTISGGAAHFVAVGSGLDSLYQLGVGDIAGKSFEVTYTISSYSSGSVRPFWGAQGGDVTASANGTYTTRFGAGSSGNTNLVFKAQAAGTTLDIDDVSVKEVTGNHVSQATSAARPLYDLTSSLHSTEFDGIDDALTSPQGGGATTAFCFMACIKPTQLGARTALFSDANLGAFTGYYLEVTAAGNLRFLAGNGASYTSVTSGNAVSAGTVYSVECYDDGTNIGVCLNNGTPVTAARPTVSAGTTAFFIGRDATAASGYFKGNIYGAIYTRNKANTPTERANAITLLRAKGGI